MHFCGKKKCVSPFYVSTGCPEKAEPAAFRAKGAAPGHGRMLTLKPNSKKLGTSPIVLSLVWALAIITTAFLFKGNPAEYWIEAGLIVGALTFVVLKRRHASASAR
jgi:hypothetical protein